MPFEDIEVNDILEKESLLEQTSPTSSSRSTSDDQSDFSLLPHRSQKRSWRSITNIALLIFLFLSFSANIYQYRHARQIHRCDSDVTGSQFSGITGGHLQNFVTNTEWNSKDIAHNDMLWEKLRFESSDMLVVSVEESKKMGLLQTDPYPFDHDLLLYDFEAFHSLHCLAYLYQSIRRIEQNLPINYTFYHLFHCLDTLHNNIVCYADDTLRPSNNTISPYGTPLVPGKPQQRQCRDFNHMVDFVKDHSACFRRYPNGDPRQDTMAEWDNCPEGSPLQKLVDKHIEKGLPVPDVKKL